VTQATRNSVQDEEREQNNIASWTGDL